MYMYELLDDIQHSASTSGTNFQMFQMPELALCATATFPLFHDLKPDLNIETTGGQFADIILI